MGTSNVAHTPGLYDRWEFCATGTEDSVVFVNDEIKVGAVYDGGRDVLMPHDVGRLIAAAPDLLSLARMMVWHIDRMKHSLKYDTPAGDQMLIEARAAIARAEGR